MIIAWDVDDVMADMSRCLHEKVTAELGECLPVAEWPDYSFGRHFGLTDNTPECYERMHALRLVEDSLPVPGAFETAQEVYRRGHRNFVVTARGWHCQGERLTTDWLYAHDRNAGRTFEGLYLTQPFQTKVDALAAIVRRVSGRIDYFVEDSLTNAREAVASGFARRALLINQPWNQGDVSDRVIRISNIRDVLDHVGDSS